MRKKILVSSIAVIVVALIGVGVWWLFSTGRLAYVANPTNTSGKVVACDDAIVDRYNEVSLYKLRGSDTKVPTYDKDGLAKLATEIQAKDGYKSDATCQAVLFFVAVRGNSYENARQSYETLLDLHKQGVYANSNIRSNEPLFNYPDFFNTLSGAPAQEE